MDIEQYNSQVFEEIKRINLYNQEYWTGRELAKLLEYDRWENFVKVVIKAKLACEKSGYATADHIAEVSNMITVGKGGKRRVNDYELSRYACYLIVQNSDPRKEVVALGQTYFAPPRQKKSCAGKMYREKRKLTGRILL